MKRIFFALVACAILVVGGFVLSTYAHADDGGAGAQCASNKC